MLSIRDLRVSMNLTHSANGRSCSRDILCGVDIDLERGCCLSLVGESGAGKTTLGLSIMGLFQGSASGEIVFQGKDLLRVSKDDYRQMRGNDMAMVFQNVEDSFDPVQRIVDQVAEAATSHRSISSQTARSLAMQQLVSVGLDEKKSMLYPHQMSGGEKQRALIAMAMINDPDLLILDEPTASLDALTKVDILRRLKSCISGRMCIVITHDLSLAESLSDRIRALCRTDMESGRTEELLNNPGHPYTRGLIRPILI